MRALLILSLLPLWTGAADRSVPTVTLLPSVVAAAPGAAAVVPVPPALPAQPAALPILPQALPGQAAAHAAAPGKGPQAGQTGPVAAIRQVQAVRERLQLELKNMEGVLGGTDPVLQLVAQDGEASLERIAGHLQAGAIDPSKTLRVHESHAAVADARPLRVGVYPVAADPFQWAHLLIGLRAIAEFKLDKVVFVLAGDDPRKPNMTPADQRHAMGRAVLDVFAPFFEYSPIAVGTQHDGETNIFRLLALNAGRAVEAFYIVGGDHYQRQYPNGKDDTIAKLENHLAAGTEGFDASKHAVSAAFIARGDEVQGSVPTTLDVRFLEAVPFEASSTLVRNGRLALMPFSAYDWVRRFLPGRFGIN